MSLWECDIVFTITITVTGSDGAKQFTRTFEVHVANVDQAPVLLPLPRQLVNEHTRWGQVLNFE